MLLTFPIWFGLATLGFMCGYIAVFFAGGFVTAFDHLGRK